MTQEIPDPVMGSPILARIHQGMKVYDQEGEEVGEVEKVYLGSVSEEDAERGAGPSDPDTPPEPGEGSIIERIAAVFTGDEDLPEVLRERLLRSGFIRIDGPHLFSSDRYIVPDQIATVTGDRVLLNVSGDALTKR